LFPAHQWVAKRIGERQGLAATLIVCGGLLLIGIPTLLLGSIFAADIHEFHASSSKAAFAIKAPEPAVAQWPVIGPKVYAVWGQAAEDLPGLLEKVRPQLRSISTRLVQWMASAAGAMFKFLGSLIIAGIMLAYGRGGAAAMLRIINRIAGPVKGPGFYGLCVATIRSVAMGVIGVAFIQALLLGGGFIAAGIPAAGVLTFIVLLLGIVQLPALLISVPVIAFLWWSGDSVTSNVVFTIYLFIAGMADNVLKPLLLGRGVDVPMPVILIGALGGMIATGILGLFLGAVIMALGYQIFMGWVAAGETQDPVPEPANAGELPLTPHGQ
jgi:predicted PurR-regulated permease PerM